MLTLKLKQKPVVLYLAAAALLIIIVASLVGWQNVRAVHALHMAQRQDSTGKITQATTTLAHAPKVLVFPHITHQLNVESAHNKALVDTAAKLAKAQQLLKEHRTSEALSLLKSISSNAGAAASSQVQSLQKTAQQQNSSTTKTSSGSGSGSGGTSSGGSSSGSGGGGSGGSGGGTGGGTTPPPPGPMTQLSISNFSATTSPRNSTSCTLNTSATFTTDGTGNVQVVWKVLSNRTSSFINNPDNYSFSAAGSQTDTYATGLQGLESGDSYRAYAVVTNSSNGSITATAGPVTLGTCAAPQALLTASQPSYMTQITPGTLGVNQVQDGIFTNECSMTLHVPFSVNSSGSVQAVYTITSGSSGGATLYSINSESFTGPGSDSDTSYIRMPHLNGGDSYSITVKIIDLGDQSIYGTAGPVSSGCS